MYIGRDTWKWLQWIGYKSESLMNDDPEENAVQFTPEISNRLFLGSEFKEILERLAIYYEVPFSKQQMLSNITVGETQAQREHNWELIDDFLNGIGFRVDKTTYKRLNKDDDTAMRNFLSELSSFMPIRTDTGSEDVIVGDGTGDTRSNLRSKDGVVNTMGDQTFQENMQSLGSGGYTTGLATGVQEPYFRDEDVDKVDLLKVGVQKAPWEMKSIPQILISSISRNFNVQPIQAASLLTNNSKYFSLILAKGLKGEFGPIQAFLAEMTYLVESLTSLALRDATGHTLSRLLQSFKSALISKSTEVARDACKLYSSLFYMLLDKGALELAYGWFINPNTAGATVAVLCLHRHPELIENITTMVVDVVRNHCEPFFEESLPALLADDTQYFRFVNTIFPSLLSREVSRLILERSGIVSRWISLANKILDSSDVGPLKKTDQMNFMVNCWLMLPDYFEKIPGAPNGLITRLSDVASTTKSPVIHTFCISKLFELLERHSLEKRKFAPDIYRFLIALVLSCDKNSSARDRLVQGFIHMFLNSPVPSGILLESYLPHFQAKLGIDFEANVFDLDFLKFLVRDKSLGNPHRLMFFDVFCKLLLSTSHGTAVFPELVELTIVLLSGQEEAVYEAVRKFVQIALRYFATTFKNKKIVPGQTNEAQYIQMHRRTLICRYFVAVARKLKEEALQEHSTDQDDAPNSREPTNPIPKGQRMVYDDIRKKTLETYGEILEFFDKSKKKGSGIKGPIKGLRDVLAVYGDADIILREYLEANGILVGDGFHSSRQNSPRGSDKPKKDKIDRNAQIIAEDRDVAEKVKAKLASGEPVTQEEKITLTRYENALRIQANKDKQNTSVIKTEGEQYSKLELYNKLREKGIVDDPVGVEKLEDFKRKLKEKQEKQIDHMVTEKLKEMQLKENLKTLLDQRRVELGVESSLLISEDTEKLIYPLDSYEANKSKFEVDRGVVEIELVDLNALEKLDADAVRYKMKEFRKLWRNIFNLYANSLKGFEKGADFNKIKDQLNRISRMEYWKFVKDYNLTNYITQDEIAVLFKLVNTKVRHNQTDLSFLDYEGHKEMMFQSICLMFSRPPIDLSHLPPMFAIEKFVDIVKKKYQDEGKKTEFFEDAEKYGVLADPQVVEYLDGELKKNKDFPIPHKYEKICEKKVVYKPSHCEALVVPDSYRVCYELVSGLVKRVIDAELLEMNPVVEEVWKVRPKTFQELEKEEIIRPKDSLFKSRSEVKIKEPKLIPNRRVLKIDHANIEPGLAIRIGMSEASMKDTDLAKECGVVLEEIYRAVEKGLESYTLLDQFEPLATENKVTRAREEQMRASVDREAQERERIKKHNEELKAKIIKKFGDLNWQDRYKKKMRTIETQIKKRANPNDFKREKSKKHMKELEDYYKSQKSKVKLHRDRVKKMMTELSKSQDNKRKKLELLKEKEFHDFNLKEVRKAQKVWRAKETYFRNMSAASLRASDPVIQKQILEPINAKHLEQFSQLRKRLESKDKDRETMITEVQKSELRTEFNKRHQKQIKLLYDYYMKQENYQLKPEDQPDLLPHSGLQSLSKDFKLVPLVLSPEEEHKLFLRFATSKHLDYENGEPGLNQIQFVKFLEEVACRKSKFFQKVFDARVATLQDFEARYRAKVEHDKKVKELAAKLEEQEQRKKDQKLGRKTGLEVIDKKEADKKDSAAAELKSKRQMSARSAKSTKSKRGTSTKSDRQVLTVEEQEELNKLKSVEEEYVLKASQSPIRYMEGLMAFLGIPDFKAGITDTIQRLKSQKALPRRQLIKEELHKLAKVDPRENKSAENLNVSQVLSELVDDTGPDGTAFATNLNRDKIRAITAKRLRAKKRTPSTTGRGADPTIANTALPEIKKPAGSIKAEAATPKAAPKTPSATTSKK